MNFILKLSITLLFFITSHSRVNNVALHLDTSELIEGPITRECMVNICQQASSVIVSGQIFYNIVRALLDEPKNNPLHLWINNIALADNNWWAYKHKASDIYLLIPKNPINRRSQEIFDQDLKTYHIDNDFFKKNNLTPIQLQYGFKIENENYTEQILLDEFKNPIIDKKKLLAQFTPSNKISLNHIIDLFIKGKDPIFPMWNIYIGGHGNYPKNINIIAGKLPQNINIQDIRLSQALIAGLSLEDFKKFINFCTNDITTNFLYYSSCYAGDVNLILPFINNLINERGNIISEINRPNFIIASGSIGSIPVITQSIESLNICIKNRISPAPINFYYFFFLLESKTQNTTKPVIFNDSELTDILRNIIPAAKSNEDPYGISALPSILFPHSNSFKALPLSDNIFVISNVLVKKYYQEKKALDVFEKQVILFYPLEIPLTIKLLARKANIPAIVSMAQGIALHRINEIQMDFILDKFANSLSFIKPIFDKYFYIKKIIYPDVPKSQLLEVFDVLIRFNQENTSYIVTTKKRGLDSIYMFEKKNNFMPELIMELPQTDINALNFRQKIKRYMSNASIAKEFNAKQLYEILSNKKPKKRFNNRQLLKELNASLSGLTKTRSRAI